MTALHDVARRFVETQAASDAAGVRIFDALAAHLAGALTAEGRAVAASSASWDGGVAAAVTRRVATVRMTELDDIHMATCTTPGAVVVPTAVTLAAALGADAGDLHRAVTIGYEAMIRLGAAIGGAHIIYRGLWPTYFCAPFTSAAVAAGLLDLDPPRMATALAIALTRATGLTSAVRGSPLARWLTLGDAARAGAAAAFAARDGFIAEVDLHRMATVAGIELDESCLRADAPDAIGMVSVKPFPTAKQSLAATEAALRLRERAAPGPVRVWVPEAYAPMIAAAPRADSRLSRVASARWNVALALLCPEELHDVERRRPVDDARLAPLAEAVEVLADAELSALYPARWPARVERSGVTETVVDATGDPALGNDLTAVTLKWRDRPEPDEEVREAALVGDASRLDQLLDRAGKPIENR